MINRILERLEEEKQRLEYQKNFFGERKNEEVVEEYSLKIFQMERVLKIVQEVAKEYGNEWISVKSELPPVEERVQVTYKSIITGKNLCDAMAYIDTNKKWHWDEEGRNPIMDMIDAEIIAWKNIGEPFLEGE